MGCSETKEDVESQMFELRLERDKIRKERNEMLIKYKLITGKNLKPKKIPDYIYTEKKKKRNKYIYNSPFTLHSTYIPRTLETKENDENEINNNKLNLNKKKVYK